MIQPTNNQQLSPQPCGANAVSINIYNPQAYGQAPQGGVQQAPYDYTNSLYQVPNNSLYNNAPQELNGQYIPAQQFMPAQNPIYAPAVNIQQPAAPAQEMPQSVINQEQNTQQTPEVVENNETQTPAINVDELVQALKSTDNAQKASAINKIAEYAQDVPENAQQIMCEPIMNALVDVINEDTSNLEGPTDKQIEIADKITKQEQLTPEEQALSEQLSPRDEANKNRIFALYTLAMIQKLQRDEIKAYNENSAKNGEAPVQMNISDLIGYNDIVNVINNDARPEVKVAAIQALQHIAEPEDKAVIEGVLANSLNSTDDAIKNAANETLAKISPDAAQASTSQAQPEEAKAEEAKTEEAKTEEKK